LSSVPDGITEPHNAEGLMYEESGRFHELISELSDGLSVEEVAKTIIQGSFKVLDLLHKSGFEFEFQIVDGSNQI